MEHMLEDYFTQINEILEKRFYGNKDFYIEMVNLFLETSKDKIEEIQRAINSGNIKEVQFSAHYIKGGAANIGAFRISKLAEQIERINESENENMILELLQKLNLELNAFHEVPSKI